MDQHKVYCSECAFLEERPTIAEVPIDSRNFIKTGTRFYCPILKKWHSLNTPKELLEFSWCIYGKKKGGAE